MAYSYKCPNCSANLLFNPDAKRMACGFCQAQISPHDIVSKRPTEGFLTGEKWDDVEQYSCGSCGANFVLGEAALTQVCAYCESPNIILSRLSKGAKPAYIIPFRYGKEGAQETFIKWCKGKRLLPKKFIRKAKIQGLTAVYIPVWLYDYLVDVEVKVAERIKSGLLYWKRIPVDASNRINQELMEQIEPFNYDYMDYFESKYIAGFIAERPEIQKEKLNAEANKRVRKFVEQAVLTSVVSEGISYGSCTDTSTYHPPVAEFALLPIWFLSCKYLGKEYKFVLNGQTGMVGGEAPISLWKLLMIGFGIFALAIPIIVGIVSLLGDYLLYG